MKHLIFCCSLLFLFFPCFSQKLEKEEIQLYQTNLSKEYKDSITSPLSKENRAKFVEHQFYPIDLSYRVFANLVLTPDEKPFKMASTKGEDKEYIKYGELNFILQGNELKLNVYRSLALMKTEKYKNYLFLPFKNLTSGKETYGGGRFIDLEVPSSKTIVLDFNKAYNPYCAYTDKYSCPITPIENTLNLEIKAGIKGPESH